MTDDLVKRLRSPEVFLMTSGMISPVAEAAADRIEKLEGSLRKISQQNTLWGAICKAKHALGDFDRKALEEKDD